MNFSNAAFITAIEEGSRLNEFAYLAGMFCVLRHHQHEGMYCTYLVLLSVSLERDLDVLMVVNAVFKLDPFEHVLTD
ncbi:hypothetical protein NKH10_13700 [Mesorhizobium sp. M1340]|uniref:hypothetical protein n=1 Tax=unclassified Mesorhizobium TaxID=325217 RepID=UPI0033396FBD